MLNIKPKYLVNEKGQKTAAVLSMKDYRFLMQRLQDLEDDLDLDEAVETATGFREYTEIRAELQKRENFDGSDDLYQFRFDVSRS